MEIDWILAAADVSTRPAADAVGFRGGRIAWVGRLAELGETRAKVVHRPDVTISPGMVDTHGHLVGYGRTLSMLDLRNLEGPDAIAAAVAGADPLGAWIMGWGWDQNRWPTSTLPTHHALSAAAPDRPVALRRICGHAIWLNAEAMRRLNISAATPDPPGGVLLRDAQGRPTGVLLDAAMTAVASALPTPTAAELRGWIDAAVHGLHRFGVTGLHDAGTRAAELSVLRGMVAEGALPLRVHALLDAEDSKNAPHIHTGRQMGDWLSVTGLKIFVDGALGSRGAWLKAPYADAPGHRGLAILEGEALRTRALRALQAGLPLCAHAIGDAAAHATIDAMAALLVPGDDLRWRIEHAQMVGPDEIQRMAALNIWAAVQPAFVSSDWSWVTSRLGHARARRSYPWRHLRDAGVRLTLGSDCPIEPPDPIAGLAAAVCRTDVSGGPSGGFHIEQALSAREALAGYTTEAARLGWVEDRRGQIKVGYDADLTLLSGDPLKVSGAALWSLKARGVVVGGRLIEL